MRWYVPDFQKKKNALKKQLFFNKPPCPGLVMIYPEYHNEINVYGVVVFSIFGPDKKNLKKPPP